ncbi:MAG: hypothetical protein F6K11_10185 [Leptolyngbya sp. SIO3F4]|nr:hypothetical protein [Leptolyngbya sp. SIO3F4]
MGDSQGNPFISNPFMQGNKKKSPASSERESTPKVPTELSLSPPAKLSEQTDSSKKVRKKSAAPQTAKSTTKPLSKSTTPKSRPSNKRKRASQPAIPGASPSSPLNNGYKVQVLAKIPMPSNTNMPSRDYLWFAVYPIIPRVGDCIFHDGRYFRIDAVFLYESTNASWCADLEVSYYTRRQ